MNVSLRVTAITGPTCNLSQRAAPSRSLQQARPFLTAGRPGSAPIPGRKSILLNARPTSDKTAQDFDSFLANLADKFEASSNKPAIVGYSAAALGAFFFVEWLIHLPGLNLILGFPLETAAVLLLPYFGVKYLIDRDSIKDDIGNAVNRVTKELPGLGK